MLIRARLSVSLDGYIATPGGWPTVEVDQRIEHGNHGDDDLAATSGAIVWGRNGFDQGFGAGWQTWPWPDKRVYVLTSRPLPEQAAEHDIVAADGGAEGLLEQLLEDSRDGRFTGDVHVAGGGKAIQSLLAVGGIDRLELLVLPVLVHTGVPLFDLQPASFSPSAWADAEESSAADSLPEPAVSLDLLSHRTFDDGVAELVYALTRPA